MAGANQDVLEIQDSETFLVSNMSPQKPHFNRQIGRDQEQAVRKLNSRNNTLKTYLLTAPIFHFDRKIETIGNATEKYGSDVPRCRAEGRLTILGPHRWR
ncbi:MAG: DNA/RNA non-specific endonuclease [Planctomycetes bacterium]|nr:DNA/RNA non-specific endonuclease [Planctomycetota bacterium]